MSRVDAYIAQVEAEKKNKWKSKGKKKSGKTPVALGYFVLMLLIVVLIETVGENFGPIAWLIQTPMQVFLYLPILGMILAAVRRSVRGAILNLGSIVLAVYLMSPIWFKGPRDAQSATFSVMTYNIEHMKEGQNKLLVTLDEKSADVFILQEATEIIDDELFRSLAFEGYTLFVSGNIALASRYPVDELREIQFEYLLDFEKNKEVFGPNPKDHGYAQIAKIRWGGQHIYVVNTHLSPDGYSRTPVGGIDALRLLARTLNYRRAQTEALRVEIAKLDGPVIYGGDLNNPPLGKNYANLTSGLHDSWREVGVGTGWTIEAKGPTKRVDYLLHNDYWRSVRAQVGHNIGSDHRSYWADFELVKPGKLDPNPIPLQGYILPIPDELKPQLPKKDPPKPAVKPAPKPAVKPVAKPPAKKPVVKAPPKKKIVAKKPVRKKRPIRRSRRRRG